MSKFRSPPQPGQSGSEEQDLQPPGTKYPQQPQYPPQFPQQPQYPPQQQPWQQPPLQPFPPQKPPKKHRVRRALGIGCSLVIALIVLIVIISVAVSHGGTTTNSNTNSNTNTNTQSTATAQPTTAPTRAITQAPQVIHYPPKTEADLRGLAAKGDASALHEFHSESVGNVGVCPQPKREVTVSPSVTGQQLAEDLLAYFYGQQLDSPCGSLVGAYHNQAEAGNAYTAGRISFDVTDSSGQPNLDPNATNLKYTLTLDTGDVATGQEYVVTY